MKTQIGDQPHTDWRAVLRGGGVMRVLPAIAMVVFGTLMIRHLSALDGAAIWQAVLSLSMWQWVCALAFTALSFYAVGRYDVIVHRILGTGQSPTTARAAGIKAIAVSQTLGFGAVTGAIVRWRCLPDMPLTQILRLSVVVSLSFLAALAAVSAIFVPLSGVLPHPRSVFALGATALVALFLLARLAHRSGVVPNKINATTLASLLAATTADTAFAALALWVLWPDAIVFQTLFAAYLLALGAGLLSNAPGGIGAFDLTLLALLGASQNEDAMAALIAFRVIYYALPMGLAVLGLLYHRPALPKRPLIHAEAALAHQTATHVMHTKGALLTLPCWGAGVVLGDLPVGIRLRDLRRRTDPRAIYKCSARQAIAARQAGWVALRCAQDAIVNPQIWTAEGPALRQLRRALAQFDRSGVVITEVHDPATLRHVAHDWAIQHGGERGHSMGRYSPDYLAQQRVFAAYDAEGPVAFVSFHVGAVWTLDLMRHSRDAPKGVMQALLRAGIAAARTAGVERLSLASVADPDPRFPFARRIQTSVAGLRRFKQAFAPHWEPRYICAAGRMRLWLVMATLACKIRWPAPLPNPNPVQANNEDYSFAPARSACEPLPSPFGDARYDERPFKAAGKPAGKPAGHA